MIKCLLIGLMIFKVFDISGLEITDCFKSSFTMNLNSFAAIRTHCRRCKCGQNILSPGGLVRDTNGGANNE